MDPTTRDDRVRAQSARLVKHLATNHGVAREDIEAILGTGLDRAARAASWTDEFSFWTDYASEYPNLAKSGAYKRLLRCIGRLIAPGAGEVWWDAGCGPLSMTRVIAEASHESVGRITASDIVLATAEEKVKEFPCGDRVDLVGRSLGSRAPFHDASVHGIVSNLVIPYVTLAEGGKSGTDAVEFVLREFFRVLRPGGTLVWSTPRKNVQFIWVFLASTPAMLNPRDLVTALQGVTIFKRALTIQRKGKKGIYSFLSKPEWEEILRRVGFTGPIEWQTSFARQAWVCKVTKP